MDTTVNHLLKGFVFAGALGAFGCQGLQAAPPLALGQLNVNGLASDGDNLFWTMASGDVRSVSTLGGGVGQVAKTISPSAPVLDTDAVYWTTNGGISRVAKAGGALDVIVENGPTFITAPQVDDTFVYWSGGADDTVQKAPKTPSATVTTLATLSVEPGTLSLTGASLYFSIGGSAAAIAQLPTSGGIPVSAVTGAFQLVGTATATLCASGIDPAAYALDPNTVAQAVTCSALDGSNAHVVASGLTVPVISLTLDDDNVYFATSDGSMSAVPVNGNSAVDMSGLSGSDTNQTTDNCFDGAGCTCSGAATGVLACDSNGIGTCQCSGSTTFAKGLPGGASLAIDQTSIYWAHSAGDAIFAMPKL